MLKAATLYVAPGPYPRALKRAGSGRLTALDPGEQCAGSGLVDKF